MKIETNNGLSILYPDKGLLLFKKSDKERSYHEVIYLAKNDNISDYGEVTHDYAYGHQYDDTITGLISENEKQQTMLELQSEVLDFFIMNGGNTSRSRNSIMLMTIASSEPNAIVRYLAVRIQAGKLDYDEVIALYPQYKEELDLILGK